MSKLRTGARAKWAHEVFGQDFSFQGTRCLSAEDAALEGLRAADDGRETIRVCECIPMGMDVFISADRVIDEAVTQLGDNGYHDEDWLMSVSEAEEEDLGLALQAAFSAWLHRHGYECPGWTCGKEITFEVVERGEDGDPKRVRRADTAVCS